MSTEGTIVIDGKERAYKFCVKQARLYCKQQSIEGGLLAYFQDFSDPVDKLAPALKSAITCIDPKFKTSLDDDALLDEIFQSGDYEEVLSALIASLPKPKENPVPSGKS